MECTSPVPDSVNSPIDPDVLLSSPHPKPGQESQRPKNHHTQLSATHQSVMGNNILVDAESELWATSSRQPTTISNVPDTSLPEMTILHPGDQDGQVEGVLGHSCCQPQKLKLDACLTIQFQATKREMDKKRSKGNKKH